MKFEEYVKSNCLLIENYFKRKMQNKYTSQSSPFKLSFNIVMHLNEFNNNMDIMDKELLLKDAIKKYKDSFWNIKLGECLFTSCEYTLIEDSHVIIMVRFIMDEGCYYEVTDH